jgi:hypothetical protein
VSLNERSRAQRATRSAVFSSEGVRDLLRRALTSKARNRLIVRVRALTALRRATETVPSLRTIRESPLLCRPESLALHLPHRWDRTFHAIDAQPDRDD